VARYGKDKQETWEVCQSFPNNRDNSKQAEEARAELNKLAEV